MWLQNTKHILLASPKTYISPTRSADFNKYKVEARNQISLCPRLRMYKIQIISIFILQYTKH
jgi:hypothetical protein